MVDENQAIIVEMLRIKNMYESRSLAKAIADAGWHCLRAEIGCKAVMAGNHRSLEQWAARFKPVRLLRPDIGNAAVTRVGVPQLRHTA